jgi:outer membrane protein
VSILTNRFTTLMLVFMVAVANQLNAQQEIRFIDMEKVYMESKEYQEIFKKIQDLQNKYRTDLQTMQQNLQTKAKDFETKQLVLSEENKAKQREELQQEAVALQRREMEIFGEQGEYYVEAQKLRAPFNQKMNLIINRIATEKGYDLILDRSAVGVYFTRDIYDITNVVLEELKSMATSTGQ